MLVQIKDLTKRFPSQKEDALKEMNVSIPKGKIIGLVGPDGAGKTTLIRLIAGLLKPTTGSITVAGYDTIQDAEFVHYLVGYMPQKFGLYEDLTVQQNLNLYADLRNVVGEEKKMTCAQLLEFTGLSPFTKRLARDLSGGMKQKLGIACALIKKPTLLLLDEPSVGVDPLSRRELWKMVKGLLEEGISVMWSTAYLDEAELCDTTLLLNSGNLLFQDNPKELTEPMQGRVFSLPTFQIDRRQLLFQLLKEDNVMDGVIQGSYLRIVVKDPSVDLNLEKKEAIPRFEDGFIDILGGGPGGRSPLAEKMPPIQKQNKTTIQADQLTKRFGQFTATDAISLEVKQGEIFGLLGPNGAGKTTLFKMLCGLLQPTTGRANVNGLDLALAPAQARSKIGYMAQKFSLYGTLSVRQNLDFFAGAYNLKRTEKAQAIEEMISIFNLKDYLPVSADLLPLGYKQRLSLACATLHFPEVLFLDEPTSGVDPITRREFWNHINGLVTRGVTIMITTHFMDEAEYCDRIALIYQGKIIELDTPDALKAKVRLPNLANPTLEDAFIDRIRNYQ